MRQFIISENTMQKTSFRNHQVKRFSSQRSTRRKPENQPTRVILFNKPYDVLPQFTDEAGRKTLKEFIPVQGGHDSNKLMLNLQGCTGKLADTIGRKALLFPIADTF